MGEPQPSVGFKKLRRYSTDNKLKDQKTPTLVGERSCKRNAGGTVFLLHDGLINVSLALRTSVGVSSSDSLPSSTISKMRNTTPYTNTSEKRLYVSDGALRKATSYVSSTAYVIGPEAYVLAALNIPKQANTAVSTVMKPDSADHVRCCTSRSQGLYTVSFTHYVTVYVLRKGSAYRVDSRSASEVEA